MFCIWLDNSKISFIDICRCELLKYNFSEDDNIKKNAIFFHILNNLDEKSMDLFKEIEINVLIGLYKDILESSFSPQLEDDLNTRLDILRFLLDSNFLKTEEVIPYLLDIETFLFDNLGLNPILILKFCFILFNFNIEEIKTIFSRLDGLNQYISKKVKSININGEYSRSEAINSSILLFNNIILSKLLDDNSDDINIIINNLQKVIEKFLDKELVDYEFSETLSYNINSIKKLNIDLKNLYSTFKLTIQLFFEELFISDRCSIDELLKVWSILINLKITEIKLSLETNIKKEDSQNEVNPFYTDRMIFFEDYQKSKLPDKIIEFVNELELCFNNKCLRACQFFIRLIIETSFYIKAQMNNQLDEFKNNNDELVGLKEWPDIAFALTFITKSQLPQTKELIKYGDLGIHNFKVSTNRAILIRKIENLREIVYNIFFNL